MEINEDHSWGNYLFRSNEVCRIILGVVLTIYLFLIPQPARAQAGSRAGPSGDEIRGGGCNSMASISPLKPCDRLPSSTSPLKIISIPVAPLSIRPKTNSLADRILTQARYYIGTPYRRGSSLQTSHTTDCSGFVQFIYKKTNIDLPRSSSEQAQMGTIVAHTLNFAILGPADLLFFSHGGRHIGHVGIYLGDGKMIHAAGRRQGVIISDLRRPSLIGAFVVAKRLAEL